MKQETIEGIVTFSGVFEDNDGSRSIKFGIESSEKNLEIICGINYHLEKGDCVRLIYSTNPEGINYGSYYFKLDKGDKTILREGPLKS